MSAELYADNHFAMVPEWIIDAEVVSDQAFRVYAVMQRYANSASGEVFPAVGTLAERLHRSDRSIQRALRELEEHSIIRRVTDPEELEYLRSMRVGGSDFAPSSFTYLLRTTPVTDLAPPGDRSDGEGGDISDTQSTESLSREGTSAHADATETLPLQQHMFQEMVFAWFQRPYEQMEPVLTKTQRQRINAAIKELVEIGTQKGEITFAAREYRAKWPDMELTPQALVKHWHSFSEEAVVTRQKEEERLAHRHTFELTDTAAGYRYVCSACGEMGPELGVVNGGGV